MRSAEPPNRLSNPLSNRRGQLPNFQGKSPGIFLLITPMLGTFGFQKSLKVLSNKVFRFIQPALSTSKLSA
ncbi:MAG: hypothetical protein EWV85_21465 [Microcystis aeruginosa Ma_QC_C_20070703_M131]|uniref:Uncharacterized protein n=1 Tax=Microcystis aeruginosa Ma_QC_C_20070703_M131 TaxID=2486263 RepID=A0A551X4S7_MICAE|nr:MAG: hypothetical protein EWV85_21465 [Microcystis aeruginosa Ma_QC_C_20070703_M131]